MWLRFLARTVGTCAYALSSRLGRTVALPATATGPLPVLWGHDSALTAHAGGAGHRPIARRLGVPDATVRGWLRRARSRTERLRVLGTVMAHDHDPMLPAIKPTATSFGDAIEALGVAARAIRMRHGGDHPGGWPAIVALTHGRLLARSWS